MSNSDSFVDEVTEELRRDQLFGYLRRYGWIAVLAVLLLVGGTAFFEIRKSQAEAEAQAVGEAMLTALEADDAAARGEALAALELEGNAQAIAGLLAAGNLEEAGDRAGAVAALDAIAGAAEVAAPYRDFAALRSILLQGSDLDIETRRAALAGLSFPGATYRMVALEQLALLEVEAGNADAAIEQFRAIVQDAETTRGLRDRALAMIVALGGNIDDLADAAQF